MLEATVLRALNWVGGAEYLRFLPHLLVLFLAIPTIVIGCLLVVTWLSTPALVRMLAQRRFPGLAQKRGGTLLASAFWSMGYTALALGIMLASLPLWLLPPLALLIPPLIWGWLVAKLLPYDVLAEHASRDERITLLKRYQELGGKYLTIGSDAHLPHSVGNHLDLAYHMAEKANLTPVYFKERKIHFVK